MPTYRMMPDECDAYAKICKLVKKHGLDVLPPIHLSTELSIMQIGKWQFMAAGGAYIGEDKAIVLYTHQNPEMEVVTMEGDTMSYRSTVKGKRFTSKCLAHEMRHIIDCQKWWHGLADKVYPETKMSESVIPRSERRSGILYKMVYWFHPLEIRARTYAAFTWRRYYRALYGASYLRDLIAELARPFADAYMDRLVLDKDMLALLTATSFVLKKQDH